MRPSFGAKPTKDGVSFRLWAPGARRVDLLLGRRRAMQRRQDGWYVAEISGLPVGSTYKFRIDDEIDVPDPASAFQPEDVFGPSEVIDHDSFAWRAKDWRGRPWGRDGADRDPCRHLHA
ncbi:1,4-alpha-glucan branching enzyme [Bradyrhizobium sp. GM24.11]